MVCYRPTLQINIKQDNNQVLISLIYPHALCVNVRIVEKGKFTVYAMSTLGVDGDEKQSLCVD
jgi:hypothetical protein